LEKNVQNVIENISKIKKTKQILKENFMINGLKCVKIGILKRELETKKELIKKLYSIKEIIKLLEVLSGNQSKYELVMELITKARTIITEFPLNIKNKIKILKKLEDKLDKYTSKSCENMIQEFYKNLSEMLTESIKINPLPRIELVFFDFFNSLKKNF